MTPPPETLAADVEMAAMWHCEEARCWRETRASNEPGYTERMAAFHDHAAAALRSITETNRVQAAEIARLQIKAADYAENVTRLYAALDETRQWIGDTIAAASAMHTTIDVIPNGDRTGSLRRRITYALRKARSITGASHDQ